MRPVHKVNEPAKVSLAATATANNAYYTVHLSITNDEAAPVHSVAISLSVPTGFTATTPVIATGEATLKNNVLTVATVLPGATQNVDITYTYSAPVPTDTKITANITGTYIVNNRKHNFTRVDVDTQVVCMLPSMSMAAWQGPTKDTVDIILTLKSTAAVESVTLTNPLPAGLRTLTPDTEAVIDDNGYTLTLILPADTTRTITLRGTIAPGTAYITNKVFMTTPVGNDAVSHAPYAVPGDNDAILEVSTQRVNTEVIAIGRKVLLETVVRHSAISGGDAVNIQLANTHAVDDEVWQFSPGPQHTKLLLGQELHINYTVTLGETDHFNTVTLTYQRADKDDVITALPSTVLLPVAPPSLTLSLAVKGANFRARDVLVYGIDYVNTGGYVYADAHLLVDLIPCMVYAAQHAPGWEANKYVLGSVEPGASGHVDLALRLTDDIPGACVAAPHIQTVHLIATDRVLATASTPVTINAQARLKVGIYMTAGRPVLGGYVTYDVVLRNTGTGIYEAPATVTVTIPAGLTWNGLNGWTQQGNMLTHAVSTVAPSVPVVTPVTFQIPAGGLTGFSITASVTYTDIETMVTNTRNMFEPLSYVPAPLIPGANGMPNGR